jgi:aerobic carbon-monoxide dehydrogenase medium subunit
MKAATFDYVRPADLSDALGALHQGGAGAKVLAGGQSLGPMLNLRLVRPTLLVDVSRIESMRRIEETKDAWRLGASVTHSLIEDANGKLRGGEMLVEVAGGIAYRGVRNRGTVGGSLAHADPAADWPLAMAALGASIQIRGAGGRTRSVPAETFVTTAFTTQLADDEIIETVSVPKLSTAARYGYFKFCRKTGEFPEASAAAVFDPERRVARVFVGALSGAPRQLPQVAELAAQGAKAALTPEVVLAALQAVDPHLDVVDQRLHVTAVFRALARALQ